MNVVMQILCMQLQTLTCIEICHICMPDTQAAEIAQPLMRHATMKNVTLDPAHKARQLSETDEALSHILLKRDASWNQQYKCRFGCRHSHW